LIELIKRYPGFTVIEATPERLQIQRTLRSSGENPKALLTRALRLILEGFATNPPRFSEDTHELLFLLSLEQYQTHIVMRMQELLRTITTGAPYYDNAFAHIKQLLGEVTAQYISFDAERAQRISRLVNDMDEIVVRSVVRTKNSLLLFDLLHCARLLGEVHRFLVQEQSTEALQRAKERVHKKQYMIGVCLVDQSNPFWSGEVSGGILGEAKGSSLAVNIDAPLVDSDADAQRNILERFLEERVDALLVVPIDSKANRVIYEKYVRAGIPIIAIDTDIELPIPHYFVGFDNYAGGKLVAAHLNKRLRKNAHVVVIEGRINGNSILRFRGFKENLRKDCTIHTLKADYVASIAYEILLQYAKEHKIDAVFAASDNMAQGAIQALNQLKIRVPVAGFDYTEDGKQAMDEGSQICDVNTHPRKLGSIAVQVCQALLNGKQVAERTIYDIEFVQA
jgi:ribose transport system substrate-binding protein